MTSLPTKGVAKKYRRDLQRTSLGDPIFALPSAKRETRTMPNSNGSERYICQSYHAIVIPLRIQRNLVQDTVSLDSRIRDPRSSELDKANKPIETLQTVMSNITTTNPCGMPMAPLPQVKVRYPESGKVDALRSKLIRLLTGTLLGAIRIKRTSRSHLQRSLGSSSSSIPRVRA
jgi:hypothetical protein